MRISDWSSDVCSSDLVRPGVGHRQHPPRGIIELKVGKHSVPVGDCLIFVAGGVIAMLFIILGRLLARFLAALDQILAAAEVEHRHAELGKAEMVGPVIKALFGGRFVDTVRSEEHTSKLQSLM